MSQLDELSSLLDESIIAEYLEQNPDFFSRHLQLLASLNLPTQNDGTLSLVQRQHSVMRQKIATLEDEITALMGIASQNQQLYQKFAQLFYQLLNCHTVEELDQSLREYFTAQLALDNVALIIFSDHAPTGLAHKRQGFENLIVQRLGRHKHYFGRINQQEQQQLFAHTLDGSLALMSLGNHGELGLLAIASHDENHFHPEMDNLMLTQLCRLISSLISRLL